VSAQDNDLARWLGQGQRAATPGHEREEFLHLVLDRTVSHLADRLDRMRSRPMANELAGGTGSLRPLGPGPCAASVLVGTTCLGAVHRGVTKDLRGSCMWLAAALTSGLPSISAAKRPAAAPPSFLCRDKVYGNGAGLRERSQGRGQ